MNRKLKAKWLRALRSGAYKQTDGALCNTKGDAFCCLGVLVDVQGCTWKEDEGGMGLVPLGKSGRRMCTSSDDWLPQRRAGGLSDDLQEKLAQMNDNGKSFDQIADYIERHL